MQDAHERELAGLRQQHETTVQQAAAAAAVLQEQLKQEGDKGQRQAAELRAVLGGKAGEVKALRVDVRVKEDQVKRLSDMLTSDIAMTVRPSVRQREGGRERGKGVCVYAWESVPVCVCALACERSHTQANTQVQALRDMKESQGVRLDALQEEIGTLRRQGKPSCPPANTTGEPNPAMIHINLSAMSSGPPANMIGEPNPALSDAAPPIALASPRANHAACSTRPATPARRMGSAMASVAPGSRDAVCVDAVAGGVAGAEADAKGGRRRHRGRHARSQECRSGLLVGNGVIGKDSSSKGALAVGADDKENAANGVAYSVGRLLRGGGGRGSS